MHWPMTDREPDNRNGVTDRSLWIGLLGGGVAWLLHLLGSYGVAEFGCVSRFSAVKFAGFSGVAWLEAGVSLAAVALAVAASLVSHHCRRKLASASTGQAGDADDARTFMAQSAVVASWLFVFIILVQSLPFMFYLREC